MSFNHVIELLINLFVLLLSARREGESGRLELRALAAFVLLLAQCLRQPRLDGPERWTGREGRGGGRVKEGGAATDDDERGSGGKKRREEDREEERKRGKEKVRGRLRVGRKVLTHSLCLLIIRSMSSFIFLYLSSDSGLWPTESSASGSGLSQPFRPFFLNVCKQSSCTTVLRVVARFGAPTDLDAISVPSHPITALIIIFITAFPQ